MRRSRARELGKIEARRHRLVGDRAVARAHRVRLRAPSRNARGIFGVLGEPLLDRRAPVVGKLAVDIGVQLVFGHWGFAFNHGPIHFISRGAAAGARLRDTP